MTYTTYRKLETIWNIAKDDCVESQNFKGFFQYVHAHLQQKDCNLKDESN